MPRTPAAGSPNQTRLQATYEALKKMSAGLASPRIGDRSVLAGGGGSKGESAKEQEGRGPGYFDVIVVDTGA